MVRGVIVWLRVVLRSSKEQLEQLQHQLRQRTSSEDERLVELQDALNNAKAHIKRLQESGRVEKKAFEKKLQDAPQAAAAREQDLAKARA